ncbi:MAG: sensor histidine kinase, partial [Chloroflexota bacterium]
HIPMRIGERSLGVISAERWQGEPFGREEQRLLVTVAGQLAAALERLQVEAGLEQRVRERTAQLEAANRELESFSYSVSHDLRAPLRGIDGYSRLLLEELGDRLDGDAGEYVARLRESAQRMGRLIDDLLRFSRLGRLPVNKAPVDPAVLVNDVLDELRPEWQDRAVQIEVGPLPPCSADPALLRQVWANLVSNALKYSSHCAQARVEISAHELDGQVVYCVRDNGVGFNMQYADKLFGVFQRLHHQDEFDGTGVGLAIVQRIVLRHGGRVWAEAQEGQGASFFFTL